LHPLEEKKENLFVKGKEKRYPSQLRKGTIQKGNPGGLGGTLKRRRSS